MKKRKQLSSRELRLLSASLDGELSRRDLKRVEELLCYHPEAVSALDNLRQIKSILKLLPSRKVPRNFTVTAQEIIRPRISTLAVGLRYVSAVSAALLAVVLAFDFVIPYQSARDALGLARSAPEAIVEEKSITSTEGGAPMIAPQPTLATAEDSEEIGGRGSGLDSEMAPDDETAEMMPLESQEDITIESEQLPQFVEKQPQANGEKADHEMIPPDDNGELLGEISEVAIVDYEITTLRILEYVFAGLSIVAALFAGFLCKRKK